MDYPPPPPPGYGPPPAGYGPPPPGGFGPPQAGYGSPAYGPPAYGPPAYGTPAYGTPGPGFDPRTQDRLDWCIVGAGLLAFVVQFFGYYSYHGYHTGPGLVGLLASLFGLVGAVAVLLPAFAPSLMPPLAGRMLGLGAFGVALVLTLLKLIVRPSIGGCAYGFCVNTQIHYGPGTGIILVFLLFVVATALSVLRLRTIGATGGRPPWEN
ncbi:MAG TPA: hypothetical protein VK816_06445 [Jatrophihabitantaceae bacterium]|nr:hypothetical protein [Jatrophihabitantaceae bacterium]